MKTNYKTKALWSQNWLSYFLNPLDILLERNEKSFKRLRNIPTLSANLEALLKKKPYRSAKPDDIITPSLMLYFPMPLEHQKIYEGGFQIIHSLDLKLGFDGLLLYKVEWNKIDVKLKEDFYAETLYHILLFKFLERYRAYALDPELWKRINSYGTQIFGKDALFTLTISEEDCENISKP
jgi:hypothetical protein